MGHAARIVGLAFTLWLGVLGVADPRASASPPCIPASRCCRVCDLGKACGNSCISRAKQCHKGRGCACDADEICAEPERPESDAAVANDGATLALDPWQ